MKKLLIVVICVGLILSAAGCKSPEKPAQIVATTLPVYHFTTTLCKGSHITVSRLITDQVSCLHDYSLQTRQMRAIEGAELIVISGGGLEAFLDAELTRGRKWIDASSGIQLHCGDLHAHDEHHHHDADPHYWLSPVLSKQMVENICAGLVAEYPEHKALFTENKLQLLQQLDQLQSYGEITLQELSCRKLITFHDGFSYFAESFGLEIIKAVEGEVGSEASAAELIEIIKLVQTQNLPAIFTERSGSTSAASIIGAETGAKQFYLDMAMSGDNYFDAMQHNIDTIKEALG